MAAAAATPTSGSQIASENATELAEQPVRPSEETNAVVAEPYADDRQSGCDAVEQERGDKQIEIPEVSSAGFAVPNIDASSAAFEVMGSPQSSPREVVSIGDTDVSLHMPFESRQVEPNSATRNAHNLMPVVVVDTTSLPSSSHTQSGIPSHSRPPHPSRASHPPQVHVQAAQAAQAAHLAQAAHAAHNHVAHAHVAQAQARAAHAAQFAHAHAHAHAQAHAQAQAHVQAHAHAQAQAHLQAQAQLQAQVRAHPGTQLQQPHQFMPHVGAYHPSSLSRSQSQVSEQSSLSNESAQQQPQHIQSSQAVPSHRHSSHQLSPSQSLGSGSGVAPQQFNGPAHVIQAHGLAHNQSPSHPNLSNHGTQIPSPGQHHLVSVHPGLSLHSSHAAHVMHAASSSQANTMHPTEQQNALHSHSAAQGVVASGDQAHQQHVMSTLSPVPSVAMQMWVPVSRVGMVIGSHGVVIKNLQEKSKATIRVHNDKINGNHKMFTLHGGHAECTLAKSMINDIIEKPRVVSSAQSHDGFPDMRTNANPDHAGNDVVETMYVPNACVGLVIGRGGDTIRDLQARSGAAIKVTPDREAPLGVESRSVQLSGAAQAVQIARQLVSEVVQAALVRKGSPLTGVEFAGGRGTSYRGVISNGETSFPNNVISNGVAAIGSSSSQGSVGNPGSLSNPAVLSSSHGDWVQTEVLTIPNDKVGLIIGRGGVTIRDLQERSGARIQIAKEPVGETSPNATRPVTVTGVRQAIQSAKSLISQKLNLFAATSARAHASPQHDGHTHPNGMGYPLSHAQYHSPSAQYLYPGFVGDPSPYNQFPSQIGYDGSDSQGAPHRAQLAYYNQYYGFHAPYAPIANSAAAMAVAQAHAAQFGHNNTSQDREAMGGTAANLGTQHEIVEDQTDVEQLRSRHGQMLQDQESSETDKGLYGSSQDRMNVYNHHARGKGNFSLSENVAFAGSESNNEVDPDGISDRQESSSIYSVDRSSVQEPSIVTSLDRDVGQFGTASDLPSHSGAASLQTGISQRDPSDASYSQSSVHLVHQAHHVVQQNHHQVNGLTLHAPETTRAVTLADRTPGSINASSQSALAASP